MPETNTITVADLNDVGEWAEHNASPADRVRINAIIGMYGREKQRQFVNQPTVWEIDWFYRGPVKELYRLALVNSETLQELWGYS